MHPGQIRGEFVSTAGGFATFVGVTMSLHKLTAGSGYDYLTRQVAAQDRTEGARPGLAAYYTERGETPGVWVGSGLAGLEGLTVGDEVTAGQMQSLFGSGHHPLAQLRQEQLQGPGLTEKDYRAVTRLGTPYPVYAGDVSPFRVQVAARLADLAADAGHPRDYPLTLQERARVRTQVAIEYFTAQHGRPPADAREVAATIAKHSRQRTTAVAGYDLTFSPVKSVSTLWAIAPRHIAAQVEAAHHDAVKDALAFIEAHALYSREGARGVRQVDVTGLVATAFTHRDSRAGDPDLHTHVAVANKVQTLDGKWLSIDGRVLFKANVSASETYNTALEKHLHTRLGLQFQERPGTEQGKRAVREIVGVDPALNQRWSTRRASIQVRRAQLATAFQADHGRPPTVVEAIALAQQATLETRDAKHEPRSLAEQRTAWRREAEQVLGGPDALTAMLATALSPNLPNRAGRVDAAWVHATAAAVLSTLQGSRSTWQVWHVRAEAQRRVRPMDVPPEQVDTVVDLLVEQVLTANSIRVTHTQDDLDEPAPLRRADGSSVYEVAGSTLYTSAAILAAEERLIAAAGRYDGHTASPDAVAIALLEQAANGVTLNAGQAAMVTGMATSGARVQLAIAPAGAGKTTTMRALTTGWTADGGTVIGLAPSAAAAAVLREQTGATTDTLAKLTWSLQHDDLPDWAQDIGPTTLVVVDEAGMADTLSLAAVVDFTIARGASVRLIGDDQQLAAIGAGGVLRDITATHGALHLTQLMRFTDPAEAAASLALRDGRSEALGFYLDRGRVHVGNAATTTDNVFTAWVNDRDQGLDTIMLAPTRELVAELNHRAQTHRINHLATGPNPGPGVALADGNTAHPGDLVITRRNERRLRTSATDWVKNGDRWTVQALNPENGSMRVRHVRTGRALTLPARYVHASVELGYATTVHGAQGVSVDTMHGTATGSESRQQLYTMLTRGRIANHIHVQVVGDGDPHTLIRPENVRPETATDLLEQVLGRDDSPTSATTMLREQADPATALAGAAARYADAVLLAAEHHLGPITLAALDAGADRIIDDLTHDPGWSTLRAHLTLLAAHGDNPLTVLAAAAAGRDLDTAGDRAAVLHWRLPEPSSHCADGGPLPWLPAVPQTLIADPTWGPYLTARQFLVTDLADSMRDRTRTGPTPQWVRHAQARPDPALLADLAVWRAATGVPDTDRRPTGGAHSVKAFAVHQRQLQARLAGGRSPALAEWAHLLYDIAPAVHTDEYTPILAERLTAVSRAGINAHHLLRAAAAEAPLPDDHAAAALWWRISRHLTPAVATSLDDSHPLTPAWTAHLATAIGTDRIHGLRDSPFWPALVTAVDHALARGHRLDTLTAIAGALDPAVDVDPCQAFVWRLCLLTDPAPPLHDDTGTVPPLDPFADQAPDPGGDGWWPPETTTPLEAPAPTDDNPPATDATLSTEQPDGMDTVHADLLAAALHRQSMGVLEPSDAQIERMVARANAWDHAVADQDRLVHINTLAMDFYAANIDADWAGGYLDDRLPGWREHPHITAGYAPAGWATAVDHLRERGVTDDELLETGLATRARTGRLIDRFRDRVVFPITHEHQILGFVGRCHPDRTDADHAGPKYLNTPTTVLFHKGEVLYGAIPALLEAGAVPVLVEGPIDALAVTLAGDGRYVGVAPLGTALTDDQASQLAALSARPIVATDADLPGRVAAERAYWLLTQHAADPLSLALPDEADPASLLHATGPAEVRGALESALPLARVLIDERLTNLPRDAAIQAATRVTAARPPSTWVSHTVGIAERLGVDMDTLTGSLRTAVTEWNSDPARAATLHLDDVSDMRTRLEATEDDATSRWVALANQIDRRLTAQSDWLALAEMLQSVHDAGHDVHDLTRRMVVDSPLGKMPAQELRYRLVVWLPKPDPSEHEGAAPRSASRRDVRHAPNAPARITTRSFR